MIRAIHRRFSDMMLDYDLIIAACLIPSFKLSWEGVEANREGIQQMILALMRRFDTDDNIGSANENDPDEDDLFLGISNSAACTEAAEETVEEEFRRYLSIPSNTTLEECYKPGAFRRLKKLFLHYNTGLPSSASVERLFSLVGAVFQPGRARLSDARLEQQSLLAANKDIVS